MHQTTKTSNTITAPRFESSENVAETSTESQADAIRRHLEAGNSLTALGALNRFGCFRLAARIHDLQSAGLLISSRPIKVGGKRVAEYRAGGVV